MDVLEVEVVVNVSVEATESFLLVSPAEFMMQSGAIETVVDHETPQITTIIPIVYCMTSRATYSIKG